MKVKLWIPFRYLINGRMRKLRPQTWQGIILLLVIALCTRASQAYSFPIDSAYKNWYYTPTGVFGTEPVLKTMSRSYVKITGRNGQEVSVLKYNPAGILVNTTKVGFIHGKLNLLTQTDKWGNTFDSVFFKPEGPDEFIVRERLRGQNPFIPCQAVRYTFKNGLLLQMLCLVDSTKPGYDQEGVSIYRFERYDDPQRFSLIKSESYFGDIDNPVISRKSDCHKMVNEYDKEGNLISKSCYGLNDEPITDRTGTSTTKYLYDHSGNQTEADYYDVKGSLVFNIYGYSKLGREYKNGFMTKEIYYADDYTIVRANRQADSVGITSYKYDAYGNPTENEFFDNAERPINNFKGVHKISYTYTSSGTLADIAHFDLRLLPVTDQLGVHRYHFETDEHGRVISLAFYSMLDKPMQHFPDGIYLTKYAYDAWGRNTTISFWQNDTVKMLTHTGYHQSLFIYNESGQISEILFQDINGRLTKGHMGCSRELVSYNDQGLISGKKYFAGALPAMLSNAYANTSHYHEIRYNYDLYNRVHSFECFDTSGNPVNALLRLDNGKELRSKRVEYSYNGNLISSEQLYDSGNTASPIVLDCIKANCLTESNRGTQLKMVLGLRTGGAGTHVYQGHMLSDSLLFSKQLAFLSQDSILIFLNATASRMTERPCAELYRISPINEYYQLDGVVRDYYQENDSIAALLAYKKGKMEGPCIYYYKNGQVKEKGIYLQNNRVGVWEYFFENGQKQKTINFTEQGNLFMECFDESGKALVQNGNGNFEGSVLSGVLDFPTETKVMGSVKNGLQDGEWRVYTNVSIGPTNIEKFSSGKFMKGTYFAKNGESVYREKSICPYISMHFGERLDHYEQNVFCSTYDAFIQTNPGYPVRSTVTRDFFPELHNGFLNILGTGKYKDYKGWIFLDIKFDSTGKINQKYLRLLHPDTAFQADILDMLDILNNQTQLWINGQKFEFEKFFVVLVEAGEVVIPEQLLRKRN